MPIKAPIKAVTFDAYGTLVRNEDLLAIPRRIVADHGLAVAVDDVWRLWSKLYFEATQVSPFRTLRQIQADNVGRLLRSLDVGADPTPYVDLYFDVTTRVELYPEVPATLAALGPLPSAIVSNADHEHVASWPFTLPVRFILISEAVGAYKPSARIFQSALERLGLRPDEVLHVGDSDVDDVKGAKARCWTTRRCAPRRWSGARRRRARPGSSPTSCPRARRPRA